MRKLIILLIICSSGTMIQAAGNIVAYRYWFNNDTIIREVTISPTLKADLELSLPTEGLPSGNHLVHFQLIDTGKIASVPISGFFQNSSGASTITGYLYWFNNKIEDAIRVNITGGGENSINNPIDATLLPEGLNTISWVAVDNLNHYSPPISQFFYRKKTGESELNKIKSWEYWIDNNFSTRISVPVTNNENMAQLLVMPDLTGLSNGKHAFHCRSEDTNGTWSVVITDTFAINVSSINQVSNKDYIAYFRDDNLIIKCMQEQAESITLINSEGKILLRRNLSEAEEAIPTPDLTPSWYMIQWHKGGKILNCRMIIKQ